MKYTIAMELAVNHLTIPYYCQHQPLIKNYSEETVGMIIAR